MKTATCSCHCRDLRPMDVSTESKPWAHVAQLGEYPGTIDIPAGYDVPGHGVVEEDLSVEGLTVFEDSNLSAMVQRFDEDVLIDYEHFSHDQDKSTEAAGWGIGLRFTTDRKGLELQSDWAAPARQKIVEKVYRHISPEFSGTVKKEGGVFKFYPGSLTGAGLTNRPKLKTLRPVSANRDNTKTNPTTMDYKSLLLTILGLAATATDDEIKAKASPAKDDLAESKNRATRITELETENKTLKTAAIDADLERFADVVTDKEATRELLQLNRATTIKLLEGQQKAKGDGNGGDPKPLFQKNRATAPDGNAHFFKEGEADAAATAKFRAVEAKANQLVNDRKIPFGHAFELAKAELGG